MSIDPPRDIPVDIDLKANQAEVGVSTTEVVEVSEPFADDGELRQWEDDAGSAGGKRSPSW